MNYIVYILINTNNNCTYVGITNNPIRRLRQHNGELKGGARYTTMKKELGKWIMHSYIPNLNKNIALSIEKKIHIHSKKYKGTPIEKRINYINDLLQKYEDIKLYTGDITFNKDNITLYTNDISTDNITSHTNDINLNIDNI